MCAGTQRAPSPSTALTCLYLCGNLSRWVINRQASSGILKTRMFRSFTQKFHRRPSFPGVRWNKSLMRFLPQISLMKSAACVPHIFHRASGLSFGCSLCLTPSCLSRKGIEPVLVFWVQTGGSCSRGELRARGPWSPSTCLYWNQ